MSDNTQGVQLVAVVGRSGSVAPWATEKTLADLVKVLDPSKKSSDTKALEDNTKALTEEQKKTQELTDALSKKAQDEKIAAQSKVQENKDLGKNLRDLGVTIGKGFANPESMMNTFSSGLGTWGRSLRWQADENDQLSKEAKAKYKELSKSIEYASKIFGVFALGYETLIKVNKSFLDMYDTGMRFDNGMTGMISSVMDTGLSMDQFAKVTKSNTQAAAMFGTSTPKMIKSFMDITGQGGELVMSQEQAAEAFLSASEIYTNAGLRQGMTNEQLSIKTSKLVKDINSLSEATGQSRSEILKFVNETFKKPETIALMATLPAQMKEGFTEFTKSASLVGPVAGKQLTAMMEKMLTGKGTMGLLDQNQQLMMAAIPQLRAGMQNMMGDIAAGRSTQSSMLEMAKSIDNIDPRHLGNILAALPPEVGAFVGEIKRMREIEKEREKVDREKVEDLKALGYSEEMAQKTVAANRKKTEEDNKLTQERLNAAMKGFNQSWSVIELALVDVGKVVLGILRPFAEALSGVARAITWVVDKISTVTSPLTNMWDDLIKKMGMFGDVVNWVINVLLAAAIYKGASGIMGGRGGGGGLLGKGKGMLGKGVGILGSLFGGGAATAEAALVGETAIAGEAALGGKLLSGGLKLGMGALKGVGGLVGGFALDYASDKLKESGNKKLGGAASVGSSALSGAGIGGSIGAIAGMGAGSWLTAPLGAAIGGALGGAYGLYQNWGDLMGGGDSQSPNGQNYQQASASWQNDVLNVFQEMNGYLNKIDQNINTMRLIAQSRITVPGHPLRDPT